MMKRGKKGKEESKKGEDEGRKKRKWTRRGGTRKGDKREKTTKGKEGG